MQNMARYKPKHVVAITFLRNKCCVFDSSFFRLHIFKVVRIFFLFLFSFFFDGTTVQCGPSPLQWTSSSQLCFRSLFPVSNFVSVNVYFIQFRHLLFGRPLIWLPRGLLINTWLSFILLSILFTWPIQFNRFVLTNESTSKSPNNCIISVLYPFLQFSCTYILLTFFIQLFFQKQPAV